ncbi:MAG: S41 family peptidase [Acidobacteria bacterium]|nr:MAG: S41 family peptidase [Acidobacteriota bacterium]REK01359.1 MAG: S41 family peptidase [Acidobacteriota bacterium]REK14315.1 MAG: S41 family peptidase [Acidobacteriota bacterium]REK45030.1 MAG: S41 family peptidase [Acidobacteriota bacterium]
MENVERDVAEALTIIQDNYVQGDDLNYNGLFKSAIDSMLHTLDPHSNYFDAKEYQEFRTSQRSQYFGIGATIGDLSDKDGKVIATFIKATFDGAPANRAGLRYGDKIVEVNGKSMLGKPYYEVRDFLRGPRGTLAKVVIERFGTKELETVEIIRDAVSTPSISEAYMLKPGIGYVAMTGGFNRTTYTEFVEAMRELKAKGMRNLVLDLRGNGGGLVREAFMVANTFLNEGETIFVQKGRIRGFSQTYSSDNGSPDKTPIVILVNGNTASASEILAGALQDHDRALIVGENTFGKGLVQNPFNLEYGSMLLLTIAKYETPSGRQIQKDYSDGNLYNYYTNGGTLDDDEKPKPPKGDPKLTDSGRIVYSGGGIAPDVMVETPTIPTARARFQRTLMNPIFAFVLDLSYGKKRGFEPYQVDRAIRFDHDITASDFPITREVFDAFKKFATSKYSFTSKQIDTEREFIERMLRTEFVTSAYGSQTSFQVYNEFDPQLAKAVELLPKAEQLAMEGAKAQAASREDRERP